MATVYENYPVFVSVYTPLKLVLDCYIVTLSPSVKIKENPLIG